MDKKKIEPEVSNCTTHHNACDCREARFAELEAENAWLRKLNDVYWAECEAWRNAAGVVFNGKWRARDATYRTSGCEINEADATDAARAEAGMKGCDADA